MQQSQHILSCIVVVIPDNTFKYLLECYLADDNEIAENMHERRWKYLVPPYREAIKRRNREMSTWRKAIAVSFSTANRALRKKDRSSTEV